MSLAGAESLFRAEFGGKPAGLAFAPGRVNLVGEHTDYNAGLVLPFAIDSHVTAALSPRPDRRVRVVSHRRSTAVESSLDCLADTRGWAAYPLGVAAVMTEYAQTDQLCGFDMAIHSDLPMGAGLSSSAALESVAAVLINQLWNCDLDHFALARVGQQAENEVVGAPTGLMDQVASVLGEADHAVLLDCRDLRHELIPFVPADDGLALLVVDTGMRHDHARGGYHQRRRECERAARQLQVTSLREVYEAELFRAERELEETLFRRVRHVVSENARVEEVVAHLRAQELDKIGPVLLASHLSLRDDFNVSTPELDLAVKSAIAAGAIGARMTGGGFGGSVIAVVPSGRSSEVAAGVAMAFRGASLAEPRVFAVHPSRGASLVS